MEIFHCFLQVHLDQDHLFDPRFLRQRIVQTPVVEFILSDLYLCQEQFLPLAPTVLAVLNLVALVLAFSELPFFLDLILLCFDLS